MRSVLTKTFLLLLWAVPSLALAEDLTLSKPTVEPYGYIKFDSAFDSGRTDVGNYARWVLSEETNSNDSELNTTANETRVGLNLKGPDTEDVKTTGKIEADFFGGGAENKSQPMMRHAYLQLFWPKENVTLTAGQTWDLISPLTPQTVNYSVLWWVGDIGYRRAQLRLTKDFVLADESKVIAAVAAAREIGHNGDFTSGDSGEDSAVPMLQARLGYSAPTSLGKPFDIGVSGHWGEEEFDTDIEGNSDDYNTWSTNGDLSFPLGAGFSVKGEVFYGQDLDSLLGGIGQGVNFTTKEEIKSIGGWAQLAYQATDNLVLNLGSGLDDPDDDDLSSGMRSSNWTIYTNGYYKITKAVTVALELSYWQTKYIELEKGDSIRTQLAFIYFF